MPNPLRSKDQASHAAAQQLANQGPTGRRSGVVAVPSQQPRAARAPQSPQTLQPLGGFPVMDLSRQVALYGSSQNVSPPDTQLAAGPNNLVEADNSVLSVWSKSGVLAMTADLNVFMGVPAGYHFSDPRILYDTESTRWFLSGLAFNATNDGQIYIAVSTTSDPLGPWKVYLVKSWTNVIGDQPMTGVSSDKVVISWNDFTGGTTFSGQETWVLEKSDLVSGVATPHAVSFGPEIKRYRLVPAQSLTPTTTQWLTYNNANCMLACTLTSPTVGVVALTGRPLAGPVNWTESDPTIGATTAPPPPRQPSAVAVTQDIDDRFLSAVWQSGTLWVSGTDGCVPAGDTTTRACMRLVEISTGGVTPTVAQDFDAAQNGVDLYYPAITLNSSGDPFIAYSASSPTLPPSAIAVNSLAGSPMSFSNPITVAAGTTSYTFGSRNRWGDYSAAAPDPINPNHVWLTAEYQASATNAGNWGTATGQFVIQPAITSLSPSFGSTAGGQVVTITGRNFQSGAAVSFGANAATNVIFVSSTQITATTPAGSAGQADVTVSQPDNTVTTAFAAYTYAVPVAYTAVAPVRLLDTRNTGQTLGNQGTLTLVISGSNNVPTTATAVVLNVTAVNETTAGAFIVYPAGTARPLASNLNWVAHQTVPNLVSVGLGAGGDITIYNGAGSADAVVDLQGYYAPAGGGSAGQYVPVVPARITDTRPGSGQVNAGMTLPPLGILDVQVMGAGGIPTSGVAAVVMNVTATNTTAAGFFTVYPKGASKAPLASNLNWTAGATVPNRVIVPVGAGGMVTVHNGLGNADLIVDVDGYFTDASGSGGAWFRTLNPFRIVDTRYGTGGFTSPLGPNQTMVVTVAGNGGVPTMAAAAPKAAVLNVTVEGATAASDLLVWPHGASPPVASDLNFVRGQTVPNLVIVKLSAAGQIDIRNDFGSTSVIVDVVGWYW